MQPPYDESKRIYLAVIVLLGLAFAFLPNIFTYYLDVQLVRGINQTENQAVEIGHFLMTPCLFFGALYIYGKRTARHFGEGYLGVALSLFVGSCIGLAIYIFSSPIVYGYLPSLSLLNSFDAMFDVITTGVQNAFIGIAALALSYLRAKPSVAIHEVLPEPAIL